MVKSLFKAVLIAGLALSTLTACEETAETPSTGSGSSFTYADLAKSWDSGCLTATDGIVTSANRTKIVLTLGSGGTFSQTQYWYTGGSCVGANYTIIYFSSGTYTIGSETSGLYPMSFTVTASSMMSMTDTASQTAVNSACGGTSPYISGVNTSYNGQGKSTYSMTCSSMTLPNSGNKFVSNVGSLSGGVLSIGTIQIGVPGVFGTTFPTSTALSLY